MIETFDNTEYSLPSLIISCTVFVLIILEIILMNVLRLLHDVMPLDVHVVVPVRRHERRHWTKFVVFVISLTYHGQSEVFLVVTEAEAVPDVKRDIILEICSDIKQRMINKESSSNTQYR